MGCNQSSPGVITTTAQRTTMIAPADQEDTNNIAPHKNMTEHEIVEVDLKKHHPGCTGMFWRPDPTGAKTLKSKNDNWPRDGAKLRGRVVEVSGEKWLLSTDILQAKMILQSGSSRWAPAPTGAAMPFDYNHHYYLEQ
jgi:hypothetical protein